MSVQDDSKPRKWGNLKNRVNDHPLAVCLTFFVLGVAGTWQVVKEVRIEQMQSQIDQMQIRIDDFNDRIGFYKDRSDASNKEVDDLTNSVQQLRKELDSLRESCEKTKEGAMQHDPRSRLEYSYWVYYGRKREDRLSGQLLFIDKEGETGRLPVSGDKIEAMGELNARIKPLEKAAVLGRVCVRDQFVVKEVRDVGGHVWVRGFGRLWTGDIACPAR